MEQTGLARRETAVPEGNGRPVNYWYAIPSVEDGTPPHTVDADEPSAEDTSSTVSSPETEHITDTTEPSEPGGDKQDGDAADGEAPQGRHDLQPDSPDEPAQAAEADDSPTPVHTPEPSAAEEAEPPAEPQNPQPTALSNSHKVRLAPGALRQMVIDHLTAHPDEA
ncbi:hypothetical protein ACH4TX_03415 [Streptomyces sp. NPDC021098]|uniref:hypothetical protein n=1 Tax=unclassified Streptomyces TaxID=2593676 RepID=UPI0037B81996